MSNFSDNNDYITILQRLLANVDDSLDKRQGSIIYDALAPAAAELAQCYIALDVFKDQTYLLSAVGENLDNKVADYGIYRKKEYGAIVKIAVYTIIYGEDGPIPAEVPIGTKYTTPDGNYTYIIKEVLEDEGTRGFYLAQAEVYSEFTNDYTGELEGDFNAYLYDIISPGEPDEDDDSLRKRTITKMTKEPFAGNKSSYISMVKNMNGVKDCKVFPAWNGGGTVKIAVISSNEYSLIPSVAFLNEIQTKIDPISNQGEGVGLAPIGHSVTVVAPSILEVRINADIILKHNFEIEDVFDSVLKSIQEYIKEVQDNWNSEDTLIIYYSKVIAAILKTPQIINVTHLEINGYSNDLEITSTGIDIYFPELGEVTLNES